VSFTFDVSQSPASAHLNSTLVGFYPDGDTSQAPRSAFFDITAQGDSEAELAGSLNGQIYLEGGKGKSDFAELGLGFFTADLLGRISRVLVPSAERDSILHCAAAYGEATDGVLVTPYGMVFQTRQANIMLRATIDLKKEKIAAQFDSRSRTGAGLSVGNVFSNTVRVRGPLTNPGLTPNATGILWRGWAALMTGGLSLIGESVVKRVLASEHPCENLANRVRKEVCGGDTPAAASSLVCPTSNPDALATSSPGEPSGW
jgi:hypothetical protein